MTEPISRDVLRLKLAVLCDHPAEVHGSHADEAPVLQTEQELRLRWSSVRDPDRPLLLEKGSLAPTAHPWCIPSPSVRHSGTLAKSRRTPGGEPAPPIERRSTRRFATTFRQGLPRRRESPSRNLPVL
jgi:hypothetical protein